MGLQGFADELRGALVFVGGRALDCIEQRVVVIDPMQGHSRQSGMSADAISELTNLLRGRRLCGGTKLALEESAVNENSVNAHQKREGRQTRGALNPLGSCANGGRFL